MASNGISLVGIGLLTFNLLLGGIASVDSGTPHEKPPVTDKEDLSIKTDFLKSSGFPFLFSYKSVDKTYLLEEGLLCIKQESISSLFGWPSLNTNLTCHPLTQQDVEDVAKENAQTAAFIKENADKIRVYAPQPMQPLKSAP